MWFSTTRKPKAASTHPDSLSTRRTRGTSGTRVTVSTAARSPLFNSSQWNWNPWRTNYRVEVTSLTDRATYHRLEAELDELVLRVPPCQPMSVGNDPKHPVTGCCLWLVCAEATSQHV